MNRQPYQKENHFYACGVAVIVAENESGETHIYKADTREQLSVSNMKFGSVYGGFETAEDCDEIPNTSVTMESGFVWLLCGGGKAGTVTGHATVTLNGGMVGGKLYGGGIGDKVGDCTITVNGGAVKWGLFCGGESLECGHVSLYLNHVTCTNVSTGTQNRDGIQTGGTDVSMRDGVVLNLNCGTSDGKTYGDTAITVTGGRIEKQIQNFITEGNLKITLWDGIFTDGSNGNRFPMLPENAEVTTIPADPDYLYGESETAFYKGTANYHFGKVSNLSQVLTRDADKLTFHFFELRDPNAPENSPFPQFIGDSYLVSFPNGETMLVDTGLPYTEPELYARLDALGITRIDCFVLTHLHIDHIGNADRIMQKYEVGEVILPDIYVPIQPTLTETYNRMLMAMYTKKIPLRRVARGDTWTVGECKISVLNPSAHGIVGKEQNNGSLAMKITYGKSVAMLGADIGEAVEVELTDLYGDALKCDLLKSSHHGIVYQNHYRYINACSPQYIAVHSLRPQGVFLRTTEYSLIHVNRIPKSRIWVTGERGTMKFTLDGNGHAEAVSEYDGIDE